MSICDNPQLLDAPPADPPLPLFPPLPPGEDYPLSALGPLCGPARALSEITQCAPAIAAHAVLAACSLAAQSKADILMPFGQSRPLSLFLFTIAGSGERKTTVDNEACAPIHAFEARLRENHRRETEVHKARSLAWESQRKRVENNRVMDLPAQARELEKLGGPPEKPMAPFLTTGDLTIEGLTRIWNSARPSLGVFTAEGGTFTGGHGMSDDNRLRTAAALSELWDGKPVKRLRAAEGVTILSGRRLAIHVQVQPEAGAAFLADGTLRDQGFLSRVLVAAPRPRAGARLFREPAAADLAELTAYRERLGAILEAPDDAAPSGRELRPGLLKMDFEASGVWRDFFDEVETEAHAEGRYGGLRDFASKAAEHAARIAGVVSVYRESGPTAVTRCDLRTGVELVRWYLGEGDRLYRTARTDPRLLRAQSVLHWMSGQDSDYLNFRTLMRNGPQAVRTKSGAEAALSVLEEHRWLRKVMDAPRTYAMATGWRAAFQA
jgi:hypothetical protein